MKVEQYRLRGLDCICGNLRMAARAVTSVYDSHLRPAGLQASQLAVLWAVAGMPDSTIKEIAARLAMDETTLVRNLRLLERRGWVTIDVGTDRRHRLAYLTKEGRDVFRAALPLWQEAQNRITEVLDGSAREMNRKLLRLARTAA